MLFNGRHWVASREARLELKRLETLRFVSTAHLRGLDLGTCISVTVLVMAKREVPVTDEPLGSHVLELQVADVVEETADARSLVFKVPDRPSSPRNGSATRPVSS